ncbi:MAG: hypothetical protein ACTSPY_09445 [Candidatus Helarchaeota archaeon]
MVDLKLIIKYYSLITLVLNGIALILNILPFIGISIVGFTGTLMFLITYFVNIGLLSINFKYANRNDPNGGRWVKNLCWIYILTSIIAVIFLVLSPLLYSFINQNNIPNLILGYSLIFGIAILLAIFNLKTINQPDAWL